MIDDESLKSLEKLHQLTKDGVITVEDFEAAKQRLLTGSSKPAAKTPTRPAAVPGEGGPRHSLGEKFDGTLPPDDNAFAWMILPLRRYADFEGRSSRKEFWMFALLQLIVLFVGYVIISADTNFLGMTGGIGSIVIALIVAMLLGTLVPTFAVQARRFHDQDRSGWLVLLNLIPYVGSFIVLAFMFVGSDEGENRFGPAPR